MSHDEDVLTAAEHGVSAPQAAHALGVSLSTIYHWSELGYLESYPTASGQRRFSRERIDGLISLLETDARGYKPAGCRAM